MNQAERIDAVAKAAARTVKTNPRMPLDFWRMLLRTMARTEDALKIRPEGCALHRLLEDLGWVQDRSSSGASLTSWQQLDLAIQDPRRNGEQLREAVVRFAILLAPLGAEQGNAILDWAEALGVDPATLR